MIEVENLTKQYGTFSAVNDLSFAVRPGIVTGFLGPNGSGQSTTMRMILGLDAPTSGTATVGGRSLSQHFAPLTSASPPHGLRFVAPDERDGAHGRTLRDHRPGRPDRGDELRDMAAGEKTHVRAEQLEDLVGLMRCDGVEIVSADRGSVSVSGLAAS